MWGRKKEEAFVPTHLYLGDWPVILTGLCTEKRVEVYGPWAGGMSKRWYEKKYLEPIYKCPEHENPLAC